MLNKEMIRMRFRVKFVVFAMLISIMGCNSEVATKDVAVQTETLVNTDHLDDLYEEIIIGSDTMGVIHIYSEYPDYGWVDDADEGIACVDDAARAAIFYLNHYQFTNSKTSLIKARRLLQFLLHMQAENDLFYNFIWGDDTINTTFKTSVAEPNWWTWRAMWALAEGHSILKLQDAGFAQRITECMDKAYVALQNHLPITNETKFINGLEKPTWLSHETATDQAAIIMLALSGYHEMNRDSSIVKYIDGQAKGIMLMQEGDSVTFPYNALLSWQNIWHAYGNSQAHALLKTGRQFNKMAMINSGLKEVRVFYPYARANHLNSFEIELENGQIVKINSSEYPQIAYNIRPMVFASLEAYNVTNDPKYAEQAGELASWFFGNNINKTQMYFPETGICYDGISGQNEVNHNSGAESTIEALLTMQMVEQNEIARKIVMDYIQNK